MGLVRIYATTDPFQGELVRARLESEGISALLKGDGAGAPYRTGPVYLFVEEEDATDAQKVLEDIGGEPLEADVAESGPASDQPAR